MDGCASKDRTVLRARPKERRTFGGGDNEVTTRNGLRAAAAHPLRLIRQFALDGFDGVGEPARWRERCDGVDGGGAVELRRAALAERMRRARSGHRVDVDGRAQRDTKQARQHLLRVRARVTARVRVRVRVGVGVRGGDRES